MRDPRHILIVPSWYSDPDSPILGSFFRDQAEALRRRGDRVGVVYAEARSLRRLSPASWRRSHFQATEGDEGGVATLRRHGWNPHVRSRAGARLWVGWTRALMRRYAARHGVPDVVHSHSALWGGAAAGAVCRQWGRPHVLTEHSTGFAKDYYAPWMHPYIRRTFREADALLAVSESLGLLIRPFAGDRPIRVVPNMVDVAFFDLPAAPARRHGDGEGRPFRFFALARLVPQKALDVLIRAFALAFCGDPDAALDIGGQGEERGGLQRLIGAEGVQDRVRLVGPLSRDGVRAALHEANAFALGSHVETFGVVFIEAMAAGLPVVATRCGGPEEFVTREVGLLVEPGDVGALAQALREVRARSRAGGYPPDRVRDYAVRRYGDVAVCDRLEEVYAQASHGAGGGKGG